MIRKSREADIEKLLNIWLEASLQAHNFIQEEHWQKMKPLVKKYYLPNSDSYVFEDKHKIKGFISIIDEKHIGALFVAPEYQRCKIGSKLIKYVKKMYVELSLKVYTKNTKALRFYQKHGFKIVAEQQDESTKENELLMSWFLESKTGGQKRYFGDS